MGIVFRIETGTQSRDRTAIPVVDPRRPQALQSEALATGADSADNLSHAASTQRALIQQQGDEATVVGRAMLGGDIGSGLERL